MPEVPAAAIPEAAWGISWQARTADDIAADDPFGGKGVRLDIPPGREVTIEDIQRVIRLEHVMLFPDRGIAWVESGPIGPELIWIRWGRWLAAPEEVT
jgi:hypothetical protein